MRLNLIGKFTTLAVLALGVSACVDVEVDVAVTSPTTARASMTQIMGADLYEMIKMSEEEEASEESFCAEGELTENADGSATCVIVDEGPFDELSMTEDDSGVEFKDLGGGLIRVSLPMEDVKNGMGVEDDMDEESKDMLTAFFEGRTFTVTISGAEVTETNMDLAADGKSASHVIPMMELIEGTHEMPDELFAVVRAP